MRPAIGVLLYGLAVLGALGAPAAPAAARELHWRELAVDARLDDDGGLEVVERHEMVFTGDWNGGERSFVLWAGQDLELESLVRIDPATGERHPLEEGDLDRVDHYDWVDGSTLRWRSRRPSDPAFDDTTLIYEIAYRLTGILLPTAEESTYRLDHDFAFSDRYGVIERFRLDLETSTAWRPVGELPRSLELAGLEPGRGVPVTVDLVYTGEGEPAAAIPGPTPLPLRLAYLAAALLAIGWLLARFFARERELGRRLGRVPAPPEIGRDWLEERVLSLRPEVVGAAWDRAIGPPEVAALVARWVAEGKVESTVTEEPRGWWGKRREIELRLLVDRDRFEGYERRLIDKLFYRRRTSVTTAELREEYRSRGFSPAGTIRSGVERARRKWVDVGKTPPPSRLPAMALAGAIVLLLVVEAFVRPAAAQWAAGFSLAAALPLYAIGFGGAYSGRKRVERLIAGSLSFLVPAALLCGAAALFLLVFHRLLGPAIAPGVLGGLAVALVPVLVVLSLTHAAMSREGRETIRRVQELVVARRWLARQLERPEPELEDAWYPYLLAFGLSAEVDRWSETFGRSAATTAAFAGATSTGGGSSSGGGGFGSGGGWTGGGQAFGGAGASATWAAAATGLASGVAAPSSSGGGGGGGGGGSSSGGGGGGGW